MLLLRLGTGTGWADLVEGREAGRTVVFCLHAASMQPAVYVTAASIGGPFSGHHLSFVPLVGNENVDFHGESSVNCDLLGISATLACRQKCLVLDSFLIRRPLVTP